MSLSPSESRMLTQISQIQCSGGGGVSPTSLKDPVLPHTCPCSLWPAFSLKCRCYLPPPGQHSLWVTAINSLLGKASSNPKAGPGLLCSASTACPLSSHYLLYGF